MNDGRFRWALTLSLYRTPRGEARVYQEEALRWRVARRIHVIPGMHGLISDGETAPKIRCRPTSMTSANISDGNKRSHPAGMNTVIMHLLDGRRPEIRGTATSDTLAPTPCTSRVVGDSERDPLHSELIHPVIGEAATAQHTITYQQSYTAQLPYRPIHPHHSTHLEFYKEWASRPSRTLSLIERTERFPDCLLVRFLWQRHGLKHPFRTTSLLRYFDFSL